MIAMFKGNGTNNKWVDESTPIPEYTEYEVWKNENIKEPDIMDMNKHELQNYARDTYGLSTKGMLPSNIVKMIYEHIHGKEVSNRGRKASTE